MYIWRSEKDDVNYYMLTALKNVNNKTYPYGHTKITRHLKLQPFKAVETNDTYTRR